MQGTCALLYIHAYEQNQISNFVQVG
jgi:hypothetical protein